jgi:hypothetical protein
MIAPSDVPLVPRPFVPWTRGFRAQTLVGSANEIEPSMRRDLFLVDGCQMTTW